MPIVHWVQPNQQLSQTNERKLTWWWHTIVFMQVNVAELINNITLWEMLTNYVEKFHNLTSHNMPNTLDKSSCGSLHMINPLHKTMVFSSSSDVSRCKICEYSIAGIFFLIFQQWNIKDLFFSAPLVTGLKNNWYRKNNDHVTGSKEDLQHFP